MSGAARRWVVGLAGVVGAVLGAFPFFPTSCWEAECPADAVDCMSSGCDSVFFTMSEAGGLFALSLLGAIAGAAILVFLMGRLVHRR